VTPHWIRTRREAEAHLFTEAARRRRAAPHRAPSLFETIAGVAAFLGLAATCLYAVARLGA
jgi:hypothetical protein